MRQRRGAKRDKEGKGCPDMGTKVKSSPLPKREIQSMPISKSTFVIIVRASSLDSDEGTLLLFFFLIEFFKPEFVS